MVGIVGVGLIGGSIVKALHAKGQETICWDPSHDQVEMASGIDEIAQRASVVFVATPPEKTADVVVELLKSSEDVIVADTASVKERICEKLMSSLTPQDFSRFIPSHPIAGRETAGWDAAQEDLFAGNNWAVCAKSDWPLDPRALQSVTDLILKMGSHVCFATPHEHDLLLARYSHLTQILASVSSSLHTQDRHLAGPAFQDLTRVASSDAHLWAQILTMNRSAISEAIRELQEELVSVQQALEENNEDDLAQMIKRGWYESESEQKDVLCPATWQEILKLQGVVSSLKLERGEFRVRLI